MAVVSQLKCEQYFNQKLKQNQKVKNGHTILKAHSNYLNSSLLVKMCKFDIPRGLLLTLCV